MKLGIIDVDTSHPASWIPVERELGHDVVGLWDGGSVHPTSYVKQFAADHNIPHVYDNIEEMVDEVDCAIIHGQNWDTHVAKARPFVEAGKAVLVDKPISGSRGDLMQFTQWARQGARITGGSCLRFCYEVQHYLLRPSDDRGTAHTAICGCAIDDFNYGIHAYSLMAGILGPGVQSVRHLCGCPQRRIQVNYTDGRMAVVIVGDIGKWLPFYATIVSETGCEHFQCINSTLYRAMLERALPYLAGEVPNPPVPMDQLIEPELTALAAKVSWENDNAEIRLNDLDDSVHFDGTAYADWYRTAKYPDS